MHSKAKETIVMVKITISFSVKACWLPNELSTSSGSFQEQKDYIFLKLLLQVMIKGSFTTESKITLIQNMSQSLMTVWSPRQRSHTG